MGSLLLMQSASSSSFQKALKKRFFLSLRLSFLDFCIAFVRHHIVVLRQNAITLLYCVCTTWLFCIVSVCHLVIVLVMYAFTLLYCIGTTCFFCIESVCQVCTPSHFCIRMYTMAFCKSLYAIWYLYWVWACTPSHFCLRMCMVLFV